MDIDQVQADGVHTTQRGIMATPPAALLRSWGRPSLLHTAQRKGSALPMDPTERGGPPPLVGLSPELCGLGWSIANFTHRTVTMTSHFRRLSMIRRVIGTNCVVTASASRAYSITSASLVHPPLQSTM